MEDKQCKQTEQFSTAKENNYFLSLDGKSKQRYKLKINNIQGYEGVRKNVSTSEKKNS